MVRICQKQNFNIFRLRLDLAPDKKWMPLYKKLRTQQGTTQVCTPIFFHTAEIFDAPGVS